MRKNIIFIVCMLVGVVCNAQNPLKAMNDLLMWDMGEYVPKKDSVITFRRTNVGIPISNHPFKYKADVFVETNGRTINIDMDKYIVISENTIEISETCFSEPFITINKEEFINDYKFALYKFKEWEKIVKKEKLKEFEKNIVDRGYYSFKIKCYEKHNCYLKEEFHIDKYFNGDKYMYCIKEFVFNFDKYIEYGIKKENEIIENERKVELLLN